MVKSVGCLDPGLGPEDHVMGSPAMILSDRLTASIAPVCTISVYYYGDICLNLCNENSYNIASRKYH